MGIATGLVVVGGEAKLGDGLAMGTTPNVAARLQAEAEPNTLVIAPLTARLAGRSFRYRSLGMRSMRGLPAPLEVFQVTGRRSTLNRFKALRASSSAPLIGRTGELEALLALWQQATEGAGQVMLLSGEAGIGKSRLVQAMRERIGPDATVLRYQCSPLHQHTMLFPVIQQLMRSIGIAGQQSTTDKLAKVQEWLPPATGDAAEFLPLLCHLLEIKSPDHPLPDVSPEQIRERTVALLSRRFMELTKDWPGPCDNRRRAVDRPDVGGIASRHPWQYRAGTGGGHCHQPRYVFARLAYQGLHDTASPRAPERRRQPTASRRDCRRAAERGGVRGHRGARRGHPAIPRRVDIGAARSGPLR